MAFEDIPPVPGAQELLDAALQAGRKAAAKITKRKTDTPATLARKKARERHVAIQKALSTRLKQFPKQFPSVDELTEFYRELIQNDIDLDLYREKLARLQNTARVVATLRETAKGQVESAQHQKDIMAVTKRFIGRLAGAINRLDTDLSWLEQVRKTFRSYPRLKQLPTVCIAGFPNVGKTTLLKRLTGASAEINEYAFTTKSLNLGYVKIGRQKVQFVDTPGTLNRDRMNAIERQAHLALKYAADVIVYVFDLTESYPLADQRKLREVIDSYGKPVISYLSKQDLLSQTQRTAFTTPNLVLDHEQLLKTIQELLMQSGSLSHSSQKSP